MAIGTGGKRKSQFNTVCQGQYGVKKRPLKWSKKQDEILGRMMWKRSLPHSTTDNLRQNFWSTCYPDYMNVIVNFNRGEQSEDVRDFLSHPESLGVIEILLLPTGVIKHSQ